MIRPDATGLPPEVLERLSTLNSDAGATLAGTEWTEAEVAQRIDNLARPLRLCLAELLAPKPQTITVTWTPNLFDLLDGLVSAARDQGSNNLPRLRAHLRQVLVHHLAPILTDEQIAAVGGQRGAQPVPATPEAPADPALVERLTRFADRLGGGDPYIAISTLQRAELVADIKALLAARAPVAGGVDRDKLVAELMAVAEDDFIGWDETRAEVAAILARHLGPAVEAPACRVRSGCEAQAQIQGEAVTRLQAELAAAHSRLHDLSVDLHSAKLALADAEARGEARVIARLEAHERAATAAWEQAQHEAVRASDACDRACREAKTAAAAVAIGRGEVARG